MPPTVKRIEQALGVSLAIAHRVRGLMDGSIDPETSPVVQDLVRRCCHEPTFAHKAMAAIDEALGTFGVEAARSLKFLDSYRGDVLATYCNTGGTYDMTVFFCNRRHIFMITSLGNYAGA